MRSKQSEILDTGIDGCEKLSDGQINCLSIQKYKSPIRSLFKLLLLLFDLFV